MIQALDNIKRVLTHPAESTFVQVPRALVTACLCATMDVSVLVLLVEFAGWNPATACIVSYLAGGIVGYILCSAWVFPNAPANAKLGFLAFTFLSLGGLALTWIVIEVLAVWMLVPYGLAKILALGLSFTWNFMTRKIFLFRSAAQPLSA